MTKKKWDVVAGGLSPVQRTQEQIDYLASDKNRHISSKAAGWLALTFSGLATGVGLAFPEARPAAFAAAGCFALASGVGFYQARRFSPR